MSSVVDMWGETVADRGFAQVPNYLLLANQFLDEDMVLSPIEMIVLIQLIGSWWKKTDVPFPSMRTIGLRSGASERQVSRTVKNLEEKGLIKRVKRRKKGMIASNGYDMMPLVEFLEKVAKANPNAFKRRVF